MRAAMRLPLLVATAHAITAPVDYVNLLAGSFTRGDVFSTGNTLPLVGRPWGFNHWALQTNDGRSAWWFNGNDHEFKWIRCTHQPSPWIGDYGWFMLGPQMGGFASSPTGFFEPRAATVLPHVLDFRTAPDGMRVELAPTMHGASLRVTFPATQRLEKRICIKLGGGGNDGYEQSNGGVDARTNRHSGAVGSNFAHHLRVESKTQAQFEARGRDCFCFAYDRGATQVEVHLATSFIGKVLMRRPCEAPSRCDGRGDGVPARYVPPPRHRRDVPRRPKRREICRKSSSPTTPCDRRARTSGTHCYQEHR